jgi:hypothetical protein
LIVWGVDYHWGGSLRGLSGLYPKIIHVATKRFSTLDAAIGETQAVLLASQVASFLGIYSLTLEGDAINIILAIQQIFS